jgi:murein DD-endopeptidase MepM/ murein hydrolase activator NlpD
MQVGEVFERAAYVLKVDPASGDVLEMSQGPIRSWMKFAALYRDWRSPLPDGPVIDQVAVLEWYLDPALTLLEERYLLGRDDALGALGFIGFVHRDQTTYPNFVWWALPPAAEIPVMTRKRTPVDRVTVTPSAPVITPTPDPVQPPVELMVRVDITAGANVRRGPTTGTPTLATLPPLTRVQVARIVPGQDGDTHRWVERREGGYIREDLLGPVTAAPVVSIARFRSPIAPGKYSITSAYQPDPEKEKKHNGVDLGAALKTPIVAGGLGQVAFLLRCVKCRPDAPSWDSQNLTEAQRTAAFNDPDWGFGYGDAVVLRLAYGDLPDAARARIDELKLPGAFAYVLFGHLDTIRVKVGQCVGPETVLGTVGLKGNTDGPHVHIEARISLKGDETSIYNRTQIDPGLIYAL